jgi:hypothetical protein
LIFLIRLPRGTKIKQSIARAHVEQPSTSCFEFSVDGGLKWCAASPTLIGVTA